MTLELITPDGLAVPDSYTQVIAASGSRMVFVAGQVVHGADGKLASPADFEHRRVKPSQM